MRKVRKGWTKWIEDRKWWRGQSRVRCVRETRVKWRITFYFTLLIYFLFNESSLITTRVSIEKSLSFPSSSFLSTSVFPHHPSKFSFHKISNHFLSFFSPHPYTFSSKLLSQTANSSFTFTLPLTFLPILLSLLILSYSCTWILSLFSPLNTFSPILLFPIFVSIILPCFLHFFLLLFLLPLFITFWSHSYLLFRHFLLIFHPFFSLPSFDLSSHPFFLPPIPPTFSL